MRHQFGWDLPPGVSVKDIEDAQEDPEDDAEAEYGNAEHVCVKCGEREAIINNVCGMCSELHPYTV